MTCTSLAIILIMSGQRCVITHYGDCADQTQRITSIDIEIFGLLPHLQSNTSNTRIDLELTHRWVADVAAYGQRCVERIQHTKEIIDDLLTQRRVITDVDAFTDDHRISDGEKTQANIYSYDFWV